MDVCYESLGPGFIDLVGKNTARVPHEGGHVGRFAPGRGGHIQHPLVLLGVESNDREEGGGGLEDVVAC